MFCRRETMLGLVRGVTGGDEADLIQSQSLTELIR